MTAFVLDVSVTMAWCFEDESTDATWRLLDQLATDTALVPTIWAPEVANVLLVAERRRRLDRAQSRAFTARLLSLPIVVEGATRGHVLRTVLTLGRETGLAAYDAIYLDLAIRHDLPLATLDRSMRAAARKSRTRVLPS
ncbi:MAG: type II toxin-antitoxin system VapC family toxin [Alphaproteobacteria bacterium]|nr:type II toxin-antitoxin system VapC family toxin [Alphaproteobacteria bacterium]